MKIDEGFSLLKEKLNIAATYMMYGWLITVLFLSTYKFSYQNAPENSDKLVHFIIYFFTSFISYLYFLKYIKNKKLLTIFSVLFAILYGIIMECIQYFLPYRSFSTGDIIANSLGAIIFGILAIPKNKLTINGQKI